MDVRDFADWGGSGFRASIVATTTECSCGSRGADLYSTAWCGYCRKAREFFAANGIRYIEYDIEKNSAAQSEHRRLGGKGVPLITVGDDVIKGYNEPALRELLRPWARG
jgi:glutaredoxin